MATGDGWLGRKKRGSGRRRRRRGRRRRRSLANVIIRSREISVPHFNMKCGPVTIIEFHIKPFLPLWVESLGLHLQSGGRGEVEEEGYEYKEEKEREGEQEEEEYEYEEEKEREREQEEEKEVKPCSYISGCQV